MIDHRTAALIAEEALRDVFDPHAVAALREDSPLSSLGITTADVVCVADAVAAHAAARGVACLLDDPDIAGVLTVAELVAAIMDRGIVEDPS